MPHFPGNYNAPLSAGVVALLVFMVALRLFALAGRVLAAAQRGEELSPERALLGLVNTAAAISIGIVWTALIYIGPSFTELAQGQGRVANWTAVLLYTWIWLSMQSAGPAKDRPGMRGQIVVRVLFYGILFLLALAMLNDW